MLGLKAIDKEDGDITNKIEIVREYERFNILNLKDKILVDSSIPGDYYIYTEVKDKGGAFARKTFKVTVKGAPKIEGIDSTVIEGTKFDILVSSEEEAIQWGVQYGVEIEIIRWGK